MKTIKSLSLSFFMLLCTAPHLQADDPDYVIVGVGTAGAVLAKELSDDKKTSVVALHTGENLTDTRLIKLSKNAIFTVLAGLLPETPPFDDEPEELKKLIEEAALPFLYERGETTPQVEALNQKLLWLLALPLGGATSINAGAWSRPTDLINKKWEEIAGPNWSVERITAIFKELENYNGKTTNHKARGFHGPIQIRQVPPSELSLKFARAIRQATGFPRVLDYNNPKTPIGVSPRVQAAQSGPNGRFRVDSPTAFLNEEVMTPDGFGVNGRKLRVHFNSFGLRAIWEGTKAVGVEYLKNGKQKEVRAKKGVIVCCGLRSSAFLLQSGIGPQKKLKSLDIPVIFHNKNVGKNLVDQTLNPCLFETNPQDTPDRKNSVFAQLSFLPAPGKNNEKREVIIATAYLIPGITATVVNLCQTKSRGSITINSNNPLDPPVIDLGILTNDEDLVTLQNAFSVYIKDISKKLHENDPKYKLIFPPPAILDKPKLLTAFIKATIQSNMCFQSHCLMAPLKQGGVVDDTGHVHGVQNLIVADASIAPAGTNGAPMATAYLCAANIAKLLKNE